MNRCSAVFTRSSFIAMAMVVAMMPLNYSHVHAQDPDGEPVAVTAPTQWSTLRSDSVLVSVQADLSKLPKGSVDFKVVKRSGSRASTLFSKSVKMDGDNSADVFLGRVRDVPLGGTDYLSVEWSVPGSDLKGIVEPVGVVRLDGAVSDSNKWIPARPPLTAVKLKDGAADAAAAEVLAGTDGFEVGGMKFAAGWNADGLYIYFTPADGVTSVEFALDLKCGKNAFLAWADRFVVYSAEKDSVSGVHSGARSVVDKEGMKFEDRAWGGDGSLSVAKLEAARLVKVRWYELGAQPFEERSVGFAVFAKGRVKKQPASYPAAAVRGVPGTWGDVKLAK